MIVGYHLIFGAYGFWLPNDPRGSWSDYVGSRDLLYHGRATKTTDPRSLAYRPHDRSKRVAAKAALRYPPVRFTGLQARAVARGFSLYLQNASFPVWACAVMPDHVHFVLGNPKIAIEIVANQLKGAATRQLVSEGLHPFAHCPSIDGRIPRCWVRGEWKVYLDTNDVPRAIRYVENNSVKEGFRKQTWSFVVPYVSQSLGTVRSEG